MSNLQDVLDRHITELKAGHEHLIAEQIEADLLALVGEDEKVYNPAPWSQGIHFKEAENIIRRKLRAKLRTAIREYCRGVK